MTKFGKQDPKVKPGEQPKPGEAIINGRRRKVVTTQPAGKNPVAPPSQRELYIVDELHERSVMSVYTTIVFKPNEILDARKDKIKLELARENNIKLRKRE